MLPSDTNLASLPRLEIGSGNSPASGFMHCDIDPKMPQLDMVCSMEAIPRFDGSFSEVRSVHSIEHVPMHKARAALKEWHRVLAPGGRVYIDTPNMERNLRLYMLGTWSSDFDILNEDQQRACSINGAPNAGLWLNFKIFSDDDSPSAWNLHRWNATPELLYQLLLQAGFRDVNIIAVDPSLIIEGFR